MHRPSKPPNPSDGSTAVAATGGSGADPEPTGAAGASAQTSRSHEERNLGRRSSSGGEPDSPSWSRAQASLGVFQTRSIFHLPRRSSSGYFSADGADSVPSSPKPLTADKATQTPSPTGQVIIHALERMADEAHGGGPGTQQQQRGHSLNPSSTRRRNAAGVMQAEAFGRELRRIGDEYNRLIILRRAADGHRQPMIPLNLMPNIHQEPVTLLCVGFLLLLLGRIIYLQGSTNSQDHSQV